MKKRFPFRLGTTSYILHDDILPNVHFLKKLVDHIELLVFEADDISNYPSQALVNELNLIAADFDLTYSVHLPIGIKLGSADDARRRRDCETVLRAIEATRPLTPLVWDLHLERNDSQSMEWSAWQDSCVDSLNFLLERGVDSARTGIETLEFDFKPVLDVLDETGFPVTLDMGHVWYCGFDEKYYLEQVLPRAVSFHVHGFNDERDHKGLHLLPTEILRAFFAAVAKRSDAHRLPVSLEVFSENSFWKSMEALNEFA